MNPGGTNHGGQRPTGDATALGTLTQILGHVRAMAARYEQQIPVFATLAHVITTAANTYTEQSRQAPAGPVAAPPGAAPGGTAGPPPADTARPLGTLAAVLGHVGKAAALATQAAVGFPAAVMAAQSALVGIGQSMIGMVAKASPAAAQRFQLAVNDAAAAIGNFLLPVFELLTAVIRQVGDAFTLLIPVGAQVAAALQPVIELVAEALAGAVGYLAGALKAVVPVLGVMVRVVMDAVGWVGRLVKSFLDLLGIDISPDAAKPGASVGMAARQAQIGGVEDVLKRAMTNAFGVGLGASDPAAKTASEAQKIRERVDEIYKWCGELPDKIKAFITQDLPAAMAKFATGSVAPAVGNAIGVRGVSNMVDASKYGFPGLGFQGAVETLRWLDRKTLNLAGD